MTIDEETVLRAWDKSKAKWRTPDGTFPAYAFAVFREGFTLAYEAAKPVPASGGVEAAGWLYDQEVGNVFSARWATKWIERQPSEMRGVRNIRQVFTLASSTPAEAEAGTGEAVHPLAAFPDGLLPGLYRIHWKSGGSSEAAIGIQSDGTRWIAPTNWIRPGMACRASSHPSRDRP